MFRSPASCKRKREQRYQFISALMPGAVLYFPGHAMLYLQGQFINLPQPFHTIQRLSVCFQLTTLPYHSHFDMKLSFIIDKLDGAELVITEIVPHW